MERYCPEITLEPYELSLAATVGCRRQVNAIAQGKPDRHGIKPEDGWFAHINGACGEMALAKCMDWFYSGSIDTYREGGDVGEIQVRTRTDHSYDLLIRHDDKDDRAYVLVLGTPCTYKIAGWMTGADAKQEQWKRTHGGRPPAYFVPQSALFDIRELAAFKAAKDDAERAVLLYRLAHPGSS